jgi:hypothetical protein
MTVRLAAMDAPPVSRLIAAVEGELTANVWTENTPTEEPDGRKNVAGTLAIAGLELVTFTVVPPAGAGALRRKISDAVDPPATAGDDSDAQETVVVAAAVAAGVTPIVMAMERPPPLTLRVAAPGELTPIADTTNNPALLPAGTSTALGTAITESFDVVTPSVSPPAGAGAVRAYVMVIPWPPVAAVVLGLIVASAAADDG